MHIFAKNFQKYLVEWNIRSTFASAFENTATVVV